MVEPGVFGQQWKGRMERTTERELDNIQHSAEHKHLICIKSNSIAGPKNNQEILATRAEGKLWFLCMRNPFSFFLDANPPAPCPWHSSYA